MRTVKCETMVAYKYEYKNRPQDDESPILVVPTSARYADQIVELTAHTYGFSLEDSYTAEEIRSHVKHFPAGQFTAVDTRTDRVVGFTASMRLAFDPNYPLLESWVETTNYG